MRALGLGGPGSESSSATSSLATSMASVSASVKGTLKTWPHAVVAVGGPWERAAGLLQALARRCSRQVAAGMPVLDATKTLKQVPVRCELSSVGPLLVLGVGSEPRAS